MGAGHFPALCLSVSIHSVDPCGYVGDGIGGLFSSRQVDATPTWRARCEGCQGQASPSAEAPPPHPTPPPGGVEQMCCLGNRWQVLRPRKLLPPRSRPPTPRALAIWCAGTVVEAQCPAQHSQVCPAASHLEGQKGGSSRLSYKPRLPWQRMRGAAPPALLLPGLKPGSAALSSQVASLSLNSPCSNSSTSASMV